MRSHGWRNYRNIGAGVAVGAGCGGNGVAGMDTVAAIPDTETGGIVAGMLVAMDETESGGFPSFSSGFSAPTP